MASDKSRLVLGYFPEDDGRGSYSKGNGLSMT
jgi:hypothetical protein